MDDTRCVVVTTCSESSHSTGWQTVQRYVYIETDLENSPLEIKTDSSLGSDETVDVLFYNSDGDIAGEVILYFTSTPQYELMGCTSRTYFSTALPTDTNKVWRITLTKTSGIRLVIHCNEMEVLNVLMSDSTCNDSYWKYFWSGNVKKTRFKSSDTASDYHRLYEGKNELEDFKFKK